VISSTVSFSLFIFCFETHKDINVRPLVAYFQANHNKATGLPFLIDLIDQNVRLPRRFNWLAKTYWNIMNPKIRTQVSKSLKKWEIEFLELLDRLGKKLKKMSAGPG